MFNFDFKSGKVIYNEFAIIIDKPLSEQKDLLLEDLIQVKYGEHLILDVGWYPELDINGKFLIQIIRNQNWDTPLYRFSCTETNSLLESLAYAVTLAEKGRG